MDHQSFTLHTLLHFATQLPVHLLFTYLNYLPSARNLKERLATFAIPPFPGWSNLHTGRWAYKHSREYELTDIIKFKLKQVVN